MKTLSKKKEATPHEIDPMLARIFLAVVTGLCSAHGRKVKEYGESSISTAAGVLDSELREAVLVAWEQWQGLLEVRRFESNLKVEPQ
jgi:hypothetical protein